MSGRTVEVREEIRQIVREEVKRTSGIQSQFKLPGLNGVFDPS
jgi:hypothetical protein